MSSPLLKRFFVSFDQNKLKGIAVAIVVFGGACGYAFIPKAPPEFPEYKISGIMGFSGAPPTATETGKALHEQGKLALDEASLFTDPIILLASRTANIKDPNKFVKKVRIKFPKTEEDPPIIRIDYSDKNKERGVKVVNLLLEQMVEESRRKNIARLGGQKEAVSKRVLVAKQELEVAEREFYDFMSKEGSSLIEGQEGTLFTAISASRQQQRDLKLQLEGINAQIASLSKQLGRNPDQAALAAALSADPIIGNLRAQILQAETQIEIVGKDLRPEHPTLANLLKQKQSYEKLLVERAREVVGNDQVFKGVPGEIRQDSSLDGTRQQLATQLITLQTQKEALDRQLSQVQRTEKQLRQDYENFPTKQLEKGRLQQQLQLKQQFYSAMAGALVDAQSAEAETIGNLIIAQPAYVAPVIPPGAPLSSSLIIVLGFVGGFLAGAGTIFVLGILDPHVYTAKELRDLLAEREVAVIGELPILLEPENSEDIPVLLGENAPYLEIYELCRSNLRQLAPKTTKVIVVTSVLADEGKSVTSYNLALASAMAGKRTLLIELNLRALSHAPSVKLGVPSDSQAEPLSHYSSHHSCVNLVPDVANLYLIPSPGPLPNPATVIESSELRRLVEDARQRYDLVILDSSALGRSNDAFLLLGLADGMVLVGRPGVTLAADFGAMLDRLTEAEMPLLGAIINGVEMPMPMTATQNKEPLLGMKAGAISTPEEPILPDTGNGAAKNGRLPQKAGLR